MYWNTCVKAKMTVTEEQKTKCDNQCCMLNHCCFKIICMLLILTVGLLIAGIYNADI